MINSGAYRQIYATMAASLSIFISGMWLGWASPATEKMVKHQTALNVTYEELSWIVCTMDLGNVISPLFAGYVMDRFGRKPSIAALGPLFIGSWLLAVYVPATWALYTARLMAGLGKGMSYTVVPVFLGEIAGVGIRGALGTVFTIQLSAGFMLEVVVGPYVAYDTLNVLSSVVPFVFFVAFLVVPESPYHLLRKGRKWEARQCLRWYRGGDGNSAHEADVDAELNRMESSVRRDMENESTFTELFSNRSNVRALAIVVVSCLAQRAGGVSSLIAYSSLMLPEPAPLMGRSEYIILFAVMLVLVNFAGLALVDRVGRKPLLISSELALSIITATFGAYYYWAAGRVTWIPYTCHVAFSVAYSVGVGFVPVVLLGEMFPVNVRSRCSAIASVTLAFFSFVSNKIFLYVSHRYGYHVMFWGFATVNLAAAYFTYLYAVETNGKTFNEIQQILEDRVQRQRRRRKSCIGDDGNGSDDDDKDDGGKTAKIQNGNL